MKMQKSSPELERVFDAAFPDDPRAERRKMFGYAAGFVNGHHFGGLFEDDVVLRLGDAEREALVREHGASAFEPMGRPMRGYVRLPSSIVHDPLRLRAWVNRAFEYGASMPPKERKPPTAKKSRRRLG